MKGLLRFIPAGSAVLGITTLASYGMGLLRDRIFAQTFGASRVLDAYNAAFLLPDLLFNVPDSQRNCSGFCANLHRSFSF